MTKKKQKFYVVWVGVTPGVYDNWSDCKVQISGFPGARYKSFSTKGFAEEAFHSGPEEYTANSKGDKKMAKIDQSDIIWDSLSVDAACSGSPGIMEYRGVWTKDGSELFRKGPFQWGTNNVGEFLALVHGISYLKKAGLEHIPVYSDSRTALSWLRNKKVKTTLQRKKTNTDLFKLLERAETWIKKNSWKNPILKWDTKKWGEIPADFGRK